MVNHTTIASFDQPPPDTELYPYPADIERALLDTRLVQQEPLA